FFNFKGFAQLCPPDPNAPQPTLNCSAAPIVCELQDFCSTLPPDETFPNQGVSGCGGFSSMDNPAFFSFIATDNTISITVVYANCTDPPGPSGPGIQLAVLTTCPAGGGQMSVVPGACFTSCNSGNPGGSTTINSSNFII